MSRKRIDKISDDMRMYNQVIDNDPILRSMMIPLYTSLICLFGTIFYLIYIYNNSQIKFFTGLLQELIKITGAVFFVLLAFVLAGVSITNQSLDGINSAEMEDESILRMTLSNGKLYLFLSLLLVIGIIANILGLISLYVPGHFSFNVFLVFSIIICFVFYYSLTVIIQIVATFNGVNYLRFLKTKDKT